MAETGGGGGKAEVEVERESGGEFRGDGKRIRRGKWGRGEKAGGDGHWWRQRRCFGQSWEMRVMERGVSNKERFVVG